MRLCLQGERNLAAELRGVGMAAFQQAEWKKKALGKAPTYGQRDTRSIKEQRESLPIFKLRDQLVEVRRLFSLLTAQTPEAQQGEFSRLRSLCFPLHHPFQPAAYRSASGVWLGQESIEAQRLSELQEGLGLLGQRPRLERVCRDLSASILSSCVRELDPEAFERPAANQDVPHPHPMCCGRSDLWSCNPETTRFLHGSIPC